MTAILTKISGNTSVNPNIPALRYGNSMESDAVDCFVETFK